jgi:hypothetical protein
MSRRLYPLISRILEEENRSETFSNVEKSISEVLKDHKEGEIVPISLKYFLMALARWKRI